ncbi:MAG: FeoB-associated Cys-rich membrane protein [Clostridia bacterium]|nr:FeoB-associated Cys-rich membrane protein [Clostridia bacterium]MBQ2433557.1 FeoB-associated Cys-rich membrane protein [Clostridia bacterium]MBQ5771658.1 FeoB-associated Cys-rich membrane protein [Clostridia bacterium]
MNPATIIVLVLVLSAFVFAVSKEIRKRKNGGCGCSGGCSGCAMRGVCHQKETKDK